MTVFLAAFVACARFFGALTPAYPAACTPSTGSTAPASAYYLTVEQVNHHDQIGPTFVGRGVDTALNPPLVSGQAA